jgi:hypothetical protein
MQLPPPSDENGNEWVDDPVPGGIEIATVMIERIQRVGWQKAWSSCDGMDICRRWTDHGSPGNYYEMPGTYVFLAGYQDLDYEQAYLLTVCTQTDEETWVDYLAVYQRHAGTQHLDVEWAQRRHLFFDQVDSHVDALHWWVDLVEVQRKRAYEIALAETRRANRSGAPDRG